MPESKQDEKKLDESVDKVDAAICDALHGIAMEHSLSFSMQRPAFPKVADNHPAKIELVLLEKVMRDTILLKETTNNSNRDEQELTTQLESYKYLGKDVAKHPKFNKVVGAMGVVSGCIVEIVGLPVRLVHFAYTGKDAGFNPVFEKGLGLFRRGKIASQMKDVVAQINEGNKPRR